MIGKVLRGRRVQGVIRYLYGPGRYNEHHNPRIIAGFDDPAALEPVLRSDGSRDFRRLEALMTQPLVLLGERNYPRPVWHVPVRAHPDDPIMSDRRWAEIAREIMHRTGLAPDGDDDAVRWVAVRHADDHIHIVATLARLDGTRPPVWNDGYRIRDACRAIEDRFGLVRTAPTDRTAARHVKRGEIEKARRHGRAEPARSTLRRHVVTAAAGAGSEEDFFARLAAEGALVRIRFSRHDPDQRTGYAVALPDDANQAGQPIWYGGGKLAADLTLPRLRHRWPAGRPGSGPPSADYQPVTGRHLSARTARAVLRTAVRRAADQARTADEFFDHLHRAGVLVHRRHSTINPGRLTGYAVTLPQHTGPDHRPLWYSGGKLADDLTLPALQRRWNGTAQPAPPQDNAAELTHEERQALYEDAARTAAYATAQIRSHTATNPYAAGDACRAASDILHIAAKTTGNPHLRRAADAYDRAGRAPHGRIPRPTPPGDALRTTARLLAMAGPVPDENTVMVMALIAGLVTLVEAITQLREAQQHSAQAAAARSAHQHLGQAEAGSRHAAPWLTAPSQVPNPFQLAMADFPTPWAPISPTDKAQRPTAQPPRSPGKDRKLSP